MRRDIQGLRGWAILLVLLFHFFPQHFPNGYIGVDIFFVISGYLVAMIMNRFDALNMDAFTTFYYRRVKRILPLYLLFILITLILLPIVFPDSFLETNTKTGLRALVFLSNVKDSSIEEYSQQLLHAVDLFTHTWSLAVEIQFYILIPFLFYFKSFFKSSTAFFGVITTISLTAYLYSEKNTSFNNVFCRIWQFLLGAMSYHSTEMETTLSTISGSGRQRMNFATYCLIVLLGTSFTIWPLDENNLRIHTTISTSILMTVGQHSDCWILTNKYINYIGDLSHSLYLFHWPVYSLVKLHHSMQSYCVGLVGLLALVIFVHHFFEVQYLKLERKWVLSLIAVLYILCFAFLFVNTQERYGQPQNLFVTTINKDSASNLTDMQIQRISIDKAISMNVEADSNFQNQFVPKQCVLAADSLMSKAKNRKFQYRKKRPFGLCVFPKSHGNNSILIIGNSYAGNQADLVYRYFKNVSSSFKLFYMSTYEPLAYTEEYQDFRNAVEKIEPDILFIIHRSMEISKQPLNVTGSLNNDTTYQLMLEQLTSFEKNTKHRVYILNAVPSLIQRPMQVAIKFLRTKQKPLQEIGDALTIFDQEPARDRIAKLGAVCKKCEVVDAMRLMSDENDHFYPYDPHTSVMYFDTAMHLTDAGLDRIAPIYQQLVRQCL